LEPSHLFLGGPSRQRAQLVDVYSPDLSAVRPGSLSEGIRKSARDHLVQGMRKAAGTLLYKPTNNEILAEYYLVRNNRTEYRPPKDKLTALMSKNKVKLFHHRLRYRKQWIVALNRIDQLIRQHFKLVTTGLIPVTNEQLPALKEREAKGDPMTQEEKNALREKEQAAMTLKFRRTQPPVKNVHSELVKDEKFRQNNDTIARITLRNDPEHKSYIRIAQQLNYEDDTTPNKQPFHNVHVELTHRNARIPNIVRDRDELDAYQPTHRIVNVSDPAWDPTLAKLYPQTTSNKDYLKGLFNSVQDYGHALYLAIFRHNEHPCTSNLFTHRTNVPAIYEDLQKVMKEHPIICVLMRGTDVDTDIEDIVRSFQELAVYDPMTAIF
jgi:hypothetical protein